MAEIQKSPKKQWETWQKQLFLALFSPFPCLIPHGQVSALFYAPIKSYSRKRATRARPCCDPILHVTLEMLRNLSFTRRNLVNFFVKNLHFFFIEYLSQICCILSSEWSSKCSSTWFAAVLNMPNRHVEIWARRSCFRCQARSGGDRNNCGTRNWSTAGHKRRKRKICCFYKDEFISRRDVEHLSLRYLILLYFRGT